MGLFRREKRERRKVFVTFGVEATPLVKLTDEGWRGSVTYEPVVRVIDGVDPVASAAWQKVSTGSRCYGEYAPALPWYWLDVVFTKDDDRIYGIDTDTLRIWNSLLDTFQVEGIEADSSQMAYDILRVRAEAELDRRLKFWEATSEVLISGPTTTRPFHQQEASVKS